MIDKIKIPKVGYFPRDKMPQLGSKEQFLDNLKKHNVDYKDVSIDSDKLKPLQSEFNKDAVRSIISSPQKARSAIVISKDRHILDGHHRWLANYNMGQNTNVIQVDMATPELLKLVKSFGPTTYKDIHHIGTIKKTVKDAIKEKKYK